MATFSGGEENAPLFLLLSVSLNLEPPFSFVYFSFSAGGSLHLHLSISLFHSPPPRRLLRGGGGILGEVGPGTRKGQIYLRRTSRRIGERSPVGASEGSQPGATRQAGRLLAARAISRSSRDPSSWELSLRVGVIQTGAFPRQSYRSLSRSREHGAVQGTAASARHHRVPDPPIWVYTPFCRFNRCTVPAPSP